MSSGPASPLHADYVSLAATDARSRRVALVHSAALMVCLSTGVVAALVLLAAPVSTRSVAVPLFLAGAGVTFGVGLSDLTQPHRRPFGRALIVTGAIWSVSTLSASADPTFYALGRVGEWMVQLGIVYLLLSYPSGYLNEKLPRRLFGGGALLLVGLYLPSLLVMQHFPLPGPWASCRTGCPSNVFALVSGTPQWVHHFVIPLREALTVGLFAAVAVVLATRRSHARSLTVPMLSPMTWVAAGLAVAFSVYLPLRASEPGSWTWPVLTWIIMLALPGVALAAFGGRQHQRMQGVRALDRMAEALRLSQTPRHVRRALADGLEDPSLQILWGSSRHPTAWVNESGLPALVPRAAGERRVTELAGGDLRVAIIHDAALAESPALLLSAGAYALAVLENEHLSDQLHASASELAESRLRGLAAEDRERRKIERDLHDGAQQRLVAVRVKLGLAAGKMEERDPAGAEVIRRLGDDVEATIDDVRAFAQGIYPHLLARTGLRDALRAMSRTAALPTVVRAQGLGRYPSEIEMTVYFCCSEALQNAAKHAQGARKVTISVWEDSGLRFEVVDDGQGFELGATFGTGLGNLQERLSAVGGQMALSSSPAGTRISGSIPLG